MTVAEAIARCREVVATSHPPVRHPLSIVLGELDRLREELDRLREELARAEHELSAVQMLINRDEAY